VPKTQAVQTYNGSNYQAPAKWSNFGAGDGPTLIQPASTGDYAGSLPAPEAIPTPTPGYGVPQYSAPVQASSHAQSAQQAYPAPIAQHDPAIQHSAPAQYSNRAQHSAPYSTPMHVGAPVDDSNCESCNQTPMQSQFAQAASQPWEGVSYAAQSCGMPAAAPVRAPLFPWFGSFDILFFDVDTNGKDRNLVSAYSAADPTRPYLPAFGLNQLDPGGDVGYSLSFGRYLGCGQYGLGATYFNFNPDAEVFTSNIYAPLGAAPGAGGGAIRASGMPHYNAAQMAYLYDSDGAGVGGYNTLDGGQTYSVYDIIDGRAGQAALNGADGVNGNVDDDANAQGVGGDAANSMAEAVRFQARRDIDIQGLEVNLFSFGLMGAQRASALGGGCGGVGGGIRSLFGGGYGGIGGYGGGNQCQPCGDPCAQSCGPRFGFGGAAGPLVRPCNGKVQVVTSHGLRWFQVQDSIDFIFDIDGREGYTGNDLYDTTSTENNLFGYQFGSRLIYCLHNRVNLNFGGKFGVYGNQAEFRHRLGTQNQAAFLGAMPDLEIDYHTEETVLSTLGELDLGLGIRATNAWTVRGGYRVMGVTGLAMADNYSRDYSSSASASALHADSSLLLHGAYVGADFNF
jgi:hypothetical protein